MPLFRFWLRGGQGEERSERGERGGKERVRGESREERESREQRETPSLVLRGAVQAVEDARDHGDAVRIVRGRADLLREVARGRPCALRDGCANGTRRSEIVINHDAVTVVVQKQGRLHLVPAASDAPELDWARGSEWEKVY